jgi:hypothetical protein
MGQVFPRVLRFSPVSFIPPVLHYAKRLNKIVSITGLHNQPQGCGASVASAAGPFTVKKSLTWHWNVYALKLSARHISYFCLHLGYEKESFRHDTKMLCSFNKYTTEMKYGVGFLQRIQKGKNSKLQNKTEILTNNQARDRVPQKKPAGTRWRTHATFCTLNLMVTLIMFVCLFVCLFQRHTWNPALAATPNLTNAPWNMRRTPSHSSWRVSVEQSNPNTIKLCKT